jgi:hypothetical protein
LTERTVPARSLLHRATVAGALAAAAVGAATGAGATSPPDTAAPSTSVPAPFVYVDGVLTPADGSFTAAFTETPTYDNDGAGIDSFIASVEEDGQSIVRYPLDGLGAAVDGPPQGRAELFAAASGSDAEWFANTPTRLGPYPASHFVVTLTLGDGSRAAVYGVVIVRESAVTYAFATDRGVDDAGAARRFVESFTVPLASPPMGGAVSSTDGRWAVTFPGDAAPTVRGSSDAGFAFTEYRAETNGDVAAVRVTEVPPGFEWRSDVVPGFGTAPTDATATTIGGLPAAASTFDEDGAAVRALVVNAGDQVISVTYTDAGTPSPSLSYAFVESFTVPAPAAPTSTVAAPASTTAE